MATHVAGPFVLWTKVGAVSVFVCPAIRASPCVAVAAEPVATSTAPAVSATASAAEILSTTMWTIRTPFPLRELLAADGPIVRLVVASSQDHRLALTVRGLVARLLALGQAEC